MRLLSFAQKGVPRYGLVEGEGVIDLSARIGTEYPSLRALLAGNALAKAADRFLGRGRADHALADIAFRPVIPDPDKILCIGINYETHRAEMGRPKPDYPTVFTRFANAQVGHGQPMIKPRESDSFDYEGEIAFVIGKAGRRIPRERAYDYIAGFSCYNDGSVRDFQRHTTQFTPGKNFVASGAFGPWLVTRDEIADAGALSLKTRLNGIEMQNAEARDMTFPFEALVAYCSTFTELAPGDVIVTGTPGGVGAARNPPIFMKPGDSVEVEISGVGILRNPISEG